MKIIAYMRCDFNEKFGIPRQSGIADKAVGKIVFEPEYSKEDAFRGIEEYSHLWIIWNFSKAERDTWSPTVRPPRLGGNKRMGVFATRSPYRPNSIGLSSVKLLGMSKEGGRIVLTVCGADLMDGTPIYDIKPYLSYTDSHPDAKCGFADEVLGYSVSVKIPDDISASLPEDFVSTLRQILAEDPRPSYIDDEKRLYTFTFGGYEISFKASGNILTVTDIKKN